MVIDILTTTIYGEVRIWDLLVVVVIVCAAMIAAKILTLNLKKGLADKMKKTELDVLQKVVYYAILFFAIVISLPILHISGLEGLLVASGFAGLVIGFASQSVVSNLVSGLFLIFERPIKIGDEIEVAETEGYVVEIRLMSTVIRNYSGLYVRVPNETVFTSSITNYVANAARRREVTIGVAYGTDIAKAQAIVMQVLDAEPFVLKRPEPECFVNDLGENSVDINVKYWSPSSEWYAMQSEVLGKLYAALDAEGIRFPFPQRVVWFADADAAKAAVPPSRDRRSG